MELRTRRGPSGRLVPVSAARALDGLPSPQQRVLSILLANLLTTTLDDLGHEWNEEPGEQGKSDPVDSSGRL